MKKIYFSLFYFLIILGPLNAQSQRNFFLNSWKPRTYSVPNLQTSKPLSSNVSSDVAVNIDPSIELAKVLPTHFGSNTTFRNGNSQVSRTSLYTNSGHGIMRYPAGSGSNKYFWDGIIPAEMEPVIDKHGETINVVGINGVNSNYMTPELFSQFIEGAGSEATVVVNYFYARYGKTSEGTREARVQQAADYAAGFVYRMNIELGANIKNWEIGNECYGKWEEGYNLNGSIVTGKEYGEDFRVFADAMKAIDPSIKVGAVVTDVDDDWNSQLLPEIKDHADFLAVHNYFTTEKDATPENVLASVVQMNEIFNTLQGCVVKYTDKPLDYFPIAMTEYNSRGVHNTTMMNGLFITQILGELIKSGYGMGTIWVSEWKWNESAQESKGILAVEDPNQADYTPRPSYMPYQYFNRCFGDMMVEASSSSSEIKVYASTFESGELGLIIVNPTANDKAVKLNIANLPEGYEYNKAWWYDFYADNLDQGNKRFYINGETGTTAGGGPENYASLAPYYSNYDTDNTFECKKYSVQFIVMQSSVVVEPPIFSNDGAQVTISCETEGASIYYTTDGSEPNSNSSLYQDSFTAPPGTEIKAVALKNDVYSGHSSLKLKYNVLFISIDDLRPVLNCYGESQIISPNIDQLADRGIVFDKAYCQWAVCGPSRASLLSGITPDATGIRNLTSSLRTENPGVITLPEYFKNKGFVTAAAGKIFDPRNVDEGHDSFSWTIPYTDPSDYTYPAEYGDFVQGSSYRVSPNTASEMGPNGVAGDGYTDGQIALDALSKLDDFASNPTQPFFLAVGFKKPHIPFVAPREYWNLYNRADMEVESFQKMAEGSPAFAYHTPEPIGYDDIPDPWTYDDVELGNGILDLDSQRKLIHGYYACVSYIDAQVGLLFDKLEQHNLDKNTVVVLFGDHGYHLGDHNQWGKHTQFENSVRAPLIIAAPGGAKGTNYSPVEFTDIYPTLCELSGLDIPNSKIQGKSLAPVLRGENLSNALAVSEYRAGGGSSYSFRTDNYRLSLWFTGSNDRPDLMEWDASRIKEMEFYDYSVDPDETINVANNVNYKILVNAHLTQAEEWWNNQYNFLTNTVEPDLTLPFTEHFENYNIGTSFEGDFWPTTSLWDRIWKGTFVDSYTAQVIDDSNNGGSKVMEFSISPISKADGGTDIKLRTQSMLPYNAENFQVSYRAKTDVIGNGIARIGSDINKINQHILTEEYQHFYDTTALLSEKLFIYFNNSDFNTNQNYKVWIDDIKISYTTASSLPNVSVKEVELNPITIYPNPFTDIIYIDTNQSISSFSIYTLSGHKIMEYKGNLSQLNLSSLKKGIYILTIKSDETIQAHKIIKQ